MLLTWRAMPLFLAGADHSQSHAGWKDGSWPCSAAWRDHLEKINSVTKGVEVCKP